MADSCNRLKSAQRYCPPPLEGVVHVAGKVYIAEGPCGGGFSLGGGRMNRIGQTVLFWTLLWVIALRAQATDVTFTDISQAAGFSNATSCSLSAAWSDYDEDGDIDVIVASHVQNNTGGTDHFYRNNGDLTFTDVIDQNGVVGFTEDPHGAGWGDFDNDGDADLVLGHGLLLGKSPQNNEFYRNAGDGTFTEIAAAAGITPQETQQITGVSWVDVNNDGLLDLFLSGKSRDQALLGNFLYQNNGDSTFTDTAVAAGLNEYDGQTTSAAWQDYDVDGDPDVFLCFNKDGQVATKLGSSVLYQNNGDGTYTDVTVTSGLVTHNTCKAAAWGDYDNDGLSDLFMTSLAANPTLLYRNNGDGTFTDVGVAAGVSETLESDGAAWGDVDNDADLDLLVVTGENDTQPNRLYKNNGDGTFSDVGASVGIAGQVEGKGADGMMMDADNDGFLDIFITNGAGGTDACPNGPYLLFHNNHENGHHWLKTQLVGQVSNRDGIGAKVWVSTSDGVTQYRQHFGPQHLMAQDRLPLHFGLGTQTVVTRIEVHWPSGLVSELSNVPADQMVTLVEPDAVAITKAIWQSNTCTLKIEASSSGGNGVVLTVDRFGSLNYNSTTGVHMKSFRGVKVSPSTVVVTSTGGGSATASVLTQGSAECML